MTDLILRLYDRLCHHRRLVVALLVATTVALGALVLGISFKEDITDFLPLSPRDRQAMRIYQSISGADRIIALVGLKDTATTDPDRVAEAVGHFAERLRQSGIGEKSITSQVDMEQAATAATYVYDNIAYFLTPADYARMDSLLSQPDYIAAQLEQDKQQLLFPSGGLLSQNISRDPLGLFTPVAMRLAQTSSAANYELYDGYIFMPDMKRAVVVIDSPYGSSETEHNGELVEAISRAAKQTEQAHQGIAISLTGGPVIAVGNSMQIKTDSQLSVVLAVVLILLLLGLTIRNWWNIMLIGVSIAWGWLFALAGLSLVDSNLSLIVVGISSVILGIAINYPLHLIAHLTHTPDMRRALREIVMPLLVGNITTIGAFLALVPLRSVALRDLGLFAALLLLGTIVFVFLFLPHLVRRTRAVPHPLLDRVSRIETGSHTWVIVVVAVLTGVLALFSLRTGFDTNLSHINYMSAEQRTDMEYLSAQQKTRAEQKEVYVVSTGRTADEAFQAHSHTEARLARLGHSVSGCGQFAVSQREQAERLARWRQFVNRHREQLEVLLPQEARKAGFADESFADFYSILRRSYKPKAASEIARFLQGAMPGSIVYDRDTKSYNVVSVVRVADGELASTLGQVKQTIDDAHHYHFEIGQMNSLIATSLSDNFNYIGYACSLIVFFFLWFSMGNIELALLSFLPMAVSWLWILGIMGLTGVDFNIVNIILATFIFGQGDDYTIFITEGCQYEYAYGRRMLSSYKNSIIISALIMFFGIGSLILARHPALHSLASLTIIGMLSVVLMAMILPPFFFRWMVSSHGRLRNRPLTLRSLLCPSRYPQQAEAGREAEYYREYVKSVYYYTGVDIVKSVRRGLADFDQLVSSSTVDGRQVLTVRGGSYGAVALMAALMHPEATVLAQTASDDDRAVSQQMACRVAQNIIMENDDPQPKP